MNTANISNHAANLVAAALSPEVPDERTYVDTRDSTILPQALVYVEGAGASGSVMYSGTLVVHVWGAVVLHGLDARGPRARRTGRRSHARRRPCVPRPPRRYDVPSRARRRAFHVALPA